MMRWRSRARQGALVVVALAAALLGTTGAAQAATPIPGGTYTFTSQGAALAVHGDLPRVYGISEYAPGAVDWIVAPQADGNVTIQNKDTGRYLAIPGTAVAGIPVVADSTAQEWDVRPAHVPGTFDIVYPGGPVDGHELTVDLSYAPAIPRTVVLRPLVQFGPAPAWRLRYLPG